MAPVLTRVGSTKVYAEESSSSDGLLALLVSTLPATPADTIDLDTAWTDPSYAGYFVLLPARPSSLPTFAQALQDSGQLPVPAHTSVAWMTYNDASQAFTRLLDLPLAPSDPAGDAGDVIVSTDTPVALRNYGLTLHAGTRVLLPHGAADLVFLYPAFPDAPPPDPTHGIRLPLDGVNRFSLRSLALLGDYSDTRDTGWDIACRFYARRPDGRLRFWRYPVLTNPAPGEQRLFAACWNLFAPLDPARTHLTFTNITYAITIDEEEPAKSSIGVVDNGGWLRSVFRSRYGRAIELRPLADDAAADPPRLVFQPLPDPDGQERRYTLVPSGDFVVRLGPLPASAPRDADDVTQAQLLCGLAGTEFIDFDTDTASDAAGAAGAPGSVAADGMVLRFHPNQAAFAPRYPIYGSSSPSSPRSPAGGPASSGAAPSAATALLNTTYRTAWISVARAAPATAPAYHSQPQRAPLFEVGGATSASATSAGTAAAGNGDALLLSPYAPPLVTLDHTDLLPMAGYGSPGHAASTMAEGPASMATFEAQILAPARFAALAPAAADAYADAAQRAGERARARLRAASGLPPAPDGEVTATTPQGLRAIIDNGIWKTVYLAQTDATGVPSTLAFHDLPGALVSALQSTDLFLVISNTANVGRFENRVTLDGWPFTVNLAAPGAQSFKNILILKFGKGTLRDRAADLGSWSQPTDFNDAPDLLSSWLSRLIDDAALQAPDEPGLRPFVELATDEQWNGILALRVDVDLRAFPEELRGLLGGMNLTRFFGHHLGVQQNRLPQAGGAPPRSSLFGLIAYRDTNGAPAKSSAERLPVSAVEPSHVSLMRTAARHASDAAASDTPDSSASAFNYRVITLVVTFRNSLVVDFESRIILTILRLFGAAAELTDSSTSSIFRNSIVFDGSFQRINGRPSYAFTSADSYRFTLTSDVMDDVDFLSAQFVTVRDSQASAGARGGGAAETLIRARFQLAGYLNFFDLHGLDIFSFGPPAGSTTPAEGLRFANFLIQMSFVLERPTELTFALDSSGMTFDTSLSHPRPRGIFTRLPLTLAQLIVGTSEQGATDLGYVAVDTPTLSRSHTLAKEWYGLVYTLNLGTLGALAQRAGFSAQLMAAWSPGGEVSPVAVLLNLPGLGAGKKGISLQSVLRLNVNDLSLTTEVDTNAQVVGYILRLRDIALSFLGKKLPSTGVTDVALFGSQSPTQGDSALSWYAAYYTAAPPD